MNKYFMRIYATLFSLLITVYSVCAQTPKEGSVTTTPAPPETVAEAETYSFPLVWVLAGVIIVILLFFIFRRKRTPATSERSRLTDDA